eukprot:m.143001 g.143001  ORF g.143001 m.143001 type:complete len:228 (-) comp17682_c0_seq5:1422-2105(-)
MSAVPKAALESEAVEYRRLADLTALASVKQHLLAQASAKESEASKIAHASPASQEESNPASKEKSTVAKPSVRRRPRVVLSSYAWDQNKEDIKLYVSLAGVEDLPVENIELVSDASSTTVEVSDLAGKDYSLKIILAKEINPASCKFKQRKGKLLVTLRKAEAGTWTYLTAKEQKAADARAPKLNKTEDDADPQASIMGMMKDMYQSGDEDMKRLIAKAWTESKDKK